LDQFEKLSEVKGALYEKLQTSDLQDNEIPLRDGVSAVSPQDVRAFLKESRTPAAWDRTETCEAIATIINEFRNVPQIRKDVGNLGRATAYNQARKAANSLRAALPDVISICSANAECPPILTEVDQRDAFRKTKQERLGRLELLSFLLEMTFPAPEAPPTILGPFESWHTCASILYRILIGPKADSTVPSRNGPAARFLRLALLAAGYSTTSISLGAIETALRRRLATASEGNDYI
jgi:hypothetical protein